MASSLAGNMKEKDYS